MHNHVLHRRADVTRERHRRPVPIDLAAFAGHAPVRHALHGRMHQQLDRRAARIAIVELGGDHMADVRRAIAVLVLAPEPAHHVVECQQFRFEGLALDDVVVEFAASGAA